MKIAVKMKKPTLQHTELLSCSQSSSATWSSMTFPTSGKFAPFPFLGVHVAAVLKVLRRSSQVSVREGLLHGDQDMLGLSNRHPLGRCCETGKQSTVTLLACNVSRMCDTPTFSHHQLELIPLNSEPSVVNDTHIQNVVKIRYLSQSHPK